MSGYFFNTYLNVIDGKGRLSIPSDYRQAILSKTQSNELRLLPSRNATCLVGFDKDRLDELMADHKARFAGIDSRERDRDATRIFGPMAALAFDEAGRIVLPPVTRRVRKLENHAFFIGLGDRFEIWDPWIYLAAPDADEIVLEALRDDMLAKKLSFDGAPAA